MAKSKIAPIKKVTIPRLELGAAELLSKLYFSVKNAMGFQNVQYFLWSDSSVALQWMNKELCDLKLFIANRVKTIRKNSEIENWNHVRTKENPADLVSRGLEADEIVHNSLWWNGPFWLRKPQEEWPKSMKINQLQPLSDMITELKVHSVFQKFTDLQTFEPRFEKTTNLINYSNNLTKLQRILAYALKFIARCKENYKKRPKFAIKREEIPSLIGTSLKLPNDLEKARAIKHFMKIEQSQVYEKEINYFNERKKNPNSTISFPKGSKLESLHPYLDEDGMLRVGGRLASAHCSEDNKHPIIIPMESRLSELIINDAHTETDHGAVQQMLQYIRNNYWISCLRNEARKHVHKCVVCARYNKKFEEQLMAGLPADRIRRNRAFLISGVDYCGPIELVERYKSRSNKRKCWIAIFVCMVQELSILTPYVIYQLLNLLHVSSDSSVEEAIATDCTAIMAHHSLEHIKS